MAANLEQTTTTTSDVPVQVATTAPVEAPEQAPANTTLPAPVATVSSDATGEGSTNEPAPARAPRGHHAQAVEQLELLLRYQVMRNGLENASEGFRALMPAHGLTPAFLAEGDALYRAADDAIARRHLEKVAAMEATAAQDAAYRLARAGYMGFRKVGRTVVTDAPGRVALFLDETVPNCMDVFAQVAQSALVAAQEEPYASLLAAVTFDPERVAALLAAVRALAAAIAVRQIAAHRATIATTERNRAVDALRVFMHRLAIEVDTMVRVYPHEPAPIGF